VASTVSGILRNIRSLDEKKPVAGGRGPLNFRTLPTMAMRYIRIDSSTDADLGDR
jgi:hypothetical protein